MGGGRGSDGPGGRRDRPDRESRPAPMVLGRAQQARTQQAAAESRAIPIRDLLRDPVRFGGFPRMAQGFGSTLGNIPVIQGEAGPPDGQSGMAPADALKRTPLISGKVSPDVLRRARSIMSRIRGDRGPMGGAKRVSEPWGWNSLGKYVE